MNNNKKGSVFYNIEKSAIITFIGIVILFSFSVAIILIAPRHIDPTWTQPTSDYQVQMYEVADPNLYISSTPLRDNNLQYVYHVKAGFTLLAFNEGLHLRIVAPSDLEKYITRVSDPELKLTSRLLMLREPIEAAKGASFDPQAAAKKLEDDFQKQWEQENPKWKEEGLIRPALDVFELYELPGTEAFALGPTESIVENWIDANFKILDSSDTAFHKDPGVIYINNPLEYRIASYTFGEETSWHFDPSGKPISNLEELKKHPLGFLSRGELIRLGEHIYAIEGCWYCHTDQTRTLVQDVVLNGSDSYPAPPSSANEYIYQEITFPGTRRIGPDMSRVGVKRPSRDWHKGHFWSPKTASEGSIMPSFRHFFDNDPRGTSKNTMGIANYRFEAIYQYMMTKGTRITPPNQAWWIGKDPIKTKEIIEGERKLPR